MGARREPAVGGNLPFAPQAWGVCPGPGRGTKVLLLVGGLLLFLFGVVLMVRGLEGAAGPRVYRWLRRLTGRPWLSLFAGVAAAALLHSSSAVTVIVLGLVETGLLSLPAAVAVILGANIGTTATAQLVSSSLTGYALAFGVAGLLALIGGRTGGLHRLSTSSWGIALLGFSLLLAGMEVMSGAAAIVTGRERWLLVLAAISQDPVLGVLGGAAITAVIQSSTAATGLVIALTRQGLVDLRGAVSLVIGSNVGTCATALLASLGTGVAGKRAAVVHLMVNVLGALVFIPLLSPFVNLVAVTGSEPGRQVANAHTLFNLLSTVAMFPFINTLARLASSLVK